MNQEEILIYPGSRLQQFDHLLKVNSPRLPPEGISAAEFARMPQPHTSVYLLAKVIRARERLEAEMVVEAEERLLARGSTEATSKSPPHSPS